MYIDPVGSYAKLTYSFFKPALELELRKRLMDYQTQLEEQIRQERANQIAGLLSQAFQDIPSPEQTYVVNQPSFTLETPQLNISPTLGVREQISQGLLGDSEIEGLMPNTPKRSEFVGVLKDPTQYRAQVYEKMLPILGRLFAYDIDATKLVEGFITQQENAYKQAESEAKELKQKLQRFEKGLKLVPMLAQKYGRELDNDTAEALSLLYANGDLKLDDLIKIFKGKYAMSVTNLNDGRALITIENEETGEVKTKFINPDTKLWERKERIKAKYKQNKGGGSKNAGTFKTQKDDMGLGITVEVPGVGQLLMLRNSKTNEIAFLNPKTGEVYVGEEARKIIGFLKKTASKGENESKNNPWIPDFVEKRFYPERFKNEDKPRGPFEELLE